MSVKNTSRCENQLPDRHLAWPQCYNTRDLGGLPARGGKVTRWRAVIRSDNLSRLTPTGQQALLDYGVRTIIDLRSPEEVLKEPSIDINNHGPHLEYRNLPIEKYYPHVSAMISQAKTRAEIYSIILDYYPDAVAEIMRAIVNTRPGGIVIHCHAGNDRTGTISALLLGLVGVPVEVIAADYAESQARLWPLYENTLAGQNDGDKADPWLKPIATVDTMVTMLEHIHARYGDIEPYLRDAGLSFEETNQLKYRLLGK
jgi:protein-tyrosine phosphatase